MKWATSIFLFWLTATASGQQPSGDDEKAGTLGQPNLLFILADNQPASLLGVYGNPDIRTPNIDQLAAEGTHGRFCGERYVLADPGDPDDRPDALTAWCAQLA